MRFLGNYGVVGIGLSEQGCRVTEQIRKFAVRGFRHPQRKLTWAVSGMVQKRALSEVVCTQFTLGGGGAESPVTKALLHG